MLYECATKLTDSLCRRYPLEKSRRSVFVYGFELLISTSLGVLSVMLFSVLLASLASAITFLFVFMALRSFSGGLHAKTYARCFILTNFTFFSVLGISTLISTLSLLPAQLLCSFFVAMSVLVIFLLAPVRNKHHHLSEIRYVCNKKISRSLAVLIGAVTLLFLLIAPLSQITQVAAVTMAAVAVMMIIPILNERRA